MRSLHTVIVGGGFAGVAVARRLSGDSEVTLIAAENFHLFTPMLAEVAAADIEPRHIVGPLRQLSPKSKVVIGEVRAIDAESCSVTVGVGSSDVEIEGDVLVLAPGSVPETFGIPGVEDWALPFKTIADALRVRRRVGALLERAAVTPNPDLTSVAIIGGGFSGAELAAGLSDFLATVGARYYPTAPPGRVVLIDASDRVTPMLPPRLSRAAAVALRRRGVELVLGRKVEAVDESGIRLDGDERLPASTVVWTAGVKPSPLVAMSGLDTEPRGRIIVDAWMQAAPGVFALGDSAAVPDGHGGLSDNTAQFALRQGRWLGKHLRALIDGEDVPSFRYRSRGQLVSLGHRNAVGLVLGMRVSGFLAWFLWRSYYLLQLPTALRKVRVAFDWTLDVVFPPDIAGIPSGDLGPPPAS